VNPASGQSIRVQLKFKDSDSLKNSPNGRREKQENSNAFVDATRFSKYKDSDTLGGPDANAA